MSATPAVREQHGHGHCMKKTCKHIMKCAVVVLVALLTITLIFSMRSVREELTAPPANDLGRDSGLVNFWPLLVRFINKLLGPAGDAIDVKNAAIKFGGVMDVKNAVTFVKDAKYIAETLDLVESLIKHKDSLDPKKNKAPVVPDDAKKAMAKLSAISFTINVGGAGTTKLSPSIVLMGLMSWCTEPSTIAEATAFVKEYRGYVRSVCTAKPSQL